MSISLFIDNTSLVPSFPRALVGMPGNEARLVYMHICVCVFVILVYSMINKN